MSERSVINTLAGQAAPLLTSDVRDTSSIVQHSLFQPTEWSKATPFVIDELRVPANNPFGFQADINFEYCKTATLLGDLAMELIIPPHQITNTLNPQQPVGDAYFVDHLGYAFIDTFTTNYAQNRVMEHNKYDLYFRYRQRHTRETQEHYNVIVFGDQTTQDRRVLLQQGTPQGQPLIVPIDYSFSFAPNESLPLVSLSQRVRWTLRSEAFSNLVVRPLDGSSTVTALGNWSVNLLLTLYHVCGAESDHFLNMTNDIDGLTYMIHQGQIQKSNLLAFTQSNVTQTIQLNNINRAIKNLKWALLPVHLQDNTGRNDYFMFNPQPPLPLPPGPGVAPGMAPYNPIIQWGLKATSLIIQRTKDNHFDRFYQRRRLFPSPPGESIFEQSYSLYPLALNSSLGFLDYNNLCNPNLEILFGVGGTAIDPDDVTQTQPQRLLLIVWADDYNFWYLNRGNWVRAFN